MPEVLRKELARPSWSGAHVAMGTNTDPYQWVEGRYKLMRGIWSALRDAANPCSVLTKSPLILRDIATAIEMHESTVSRVTTNKYVHTPQGVLELRSFFSESVNGPQGGEMSLLSLKRRVKQMIEEEDTSHPLTDEQITKKLSEEGIHVTRRTVAKYREDLRIPSTHRRRVKA